MSANNSSSSFASPTTSSSSLSSSSSSSNVSFFDASCHGTTYADDGTNLSLRIYFFSSLLFVFVGLVGNTLSMLVFTSKDMLTVSSNAYLLLLAASDSLYLISVFFTKTLTIMRCWYFVTSEADIVNRSHVVCVLLQYLSDLFSDYSTCLILAFTVERSVAVFLPIKFKELCTVWRARVLCLSIFVVVASFIAPYHVLSIALYPDYHVCAIRVEHEAIFSILYVVEMSVFRVVPVLLIAILNAFIIARVTRLTREKNRRRDAAQKLLDSKTKGRRGRRKTTKKGRRVKSEDRNLQLTMILILVSMSYVIAYVPVLLHFVLYKLHLSNVIAVDGNWLDIMGNCSKALYISGFAINFFLYTVSGRVFRDQLKSLLCRRFSSVVTKRNRTTTHCTLATTAPEVSSVL